MITYTDHRRGFTLVEAIIVVVVIVVLLAVLVPVLRNREWARLQVLADTGPQNVFEFRATPAKSGFLETEDIVIQCEIENLTRY